MMPASNAGVGMNMGFPDVCTTPAAPSPIPVPYPNMGMNAQELPPAGGGRILFSGCPAHNMGGKPAMTSGDEGGTAHPMFKMPGGCMTGNPKILLGGMPAEHLGTPSFGNNYNDGLGAKTVPSVTNVLLTGLGTSLPDARGLGRWSGGGLALLAAELGDLPSASLGLTVSPGRGGLEVAHVRAGGLGVRLGVRAGDVLLSVNGEPASLDPELPTVRAGQRVRLGVRRGSRRFSRVGRVRSTPSVSGALGADGVAVLALRRCSLPAPERVRDRLRAFASAGARGVVLDLRGNPGGCLHSAARVAGLFLEAGLPFAHVRDHAGLRRVPVAGQGPEWRGPLVVLLDSQTASAGEALAAALQDHARAALIGQPTFGKGYGEHVWVWGPRASASGAALSLSRIDGRPLRRVTPTRAGGLEAARRLVRCLP
jgi:carboxyl-terminal processing protease